MLKKLLALLIPTLFFSCSDDMQQNNSGGSQTPTEYAKKLPVDPTFGWSSLKTESITVTKPSSAIYVVTGDNETLLAENLSSGTYTFTIPNSATGLKVKESILKSAQAGSNVYFPAESPNQWAMMMVEDVFPNLGDLDMNDIIIHFRIKYEIDQSVNFNVNESPVVKAVVFTLAPKAVGGVLYEKIGIALNFTKIDMAVKSVSGQKLTGSMFNVIADGVGKGSENGNVIPLTDDLRALFRGANSKKEIINTYNGIPQLSANEFTVRIELSEGVRLSDIQPVLNTKGHMLDLFVTLGERGNEVHLKGHPATSLLNENLKKYAGYSSEKENWVWAIMLPSSIKYPKEGTPIYDAYPDFKEWVKGDMSNSDDWSFSHIFENIYR